MTQVRSGGWLPDTTLADRRSAAVACHHAVGTSAAAYLVAVAAHDVCRSEVPFSVDTAPIQCLTGDVVQPPCIGRPWRQRDLVFPLLSVLGAHGLHDRSADIEDIPLCWSDDFS